MYQSVAALGKEADAAKYRMLFQKIKTAFCGKYLDNSGRFRNGFQSIYVLGVHFQLLDEKSKKQAVEDLVADIQARDYHLATGFVGTLFLNYVLSDNGYAKLCIWSDW